MRVSKKTNKDEEFKPVVIEPIEGQMRYDELLVPQKEEPKEEKPVMVDGQIDMWNMGENLSFKSAKTKTISKVIPSTSKEEEKTDNSSDGGLVGGASLKADFGKIVNYK